MQQYKKNLGKVSLTSEGAWAINKSFEILSIVYDENTKQGFISRKDVPIGVDINNREYWMPLNVSGYADNNIIILSEKTSDTNIKSYTLEEAINSIASVGRKPGVILGFYNENSDRLDIGGRWEVWQFNSTTISEWEDISHWQNIYYNYNKFVGWYKSENSLKKYNPFPEIGCYAFVGTELNEATVYRCDKKYVWEDTTQHAWDYIKIIIDGTVTVGENGNWFNNGVDTNIPASVKGENGKTPIFRNNNNIIEFSYDNESWKPISDEIAAWFRWESKGGQQAFSTGKIQITRDGVTWKDLSGEFVNNLRISRYIGADESLPTSGIVEGTIYAKGPTYADEDTSHANPIYRLWVYAWKGNTLAWQDNGEFQSIAAGVVQETGDSETEVMSQKAVSDGLSELGQYVENPEYARAYTDAEGRFLWGIKQDGSIEFAKGVPTPIKNYIVEFVINRIDNTIIPEIETLKEAHEQYLKEYESPEWARVIVDVDGRVLWGIRQDGSVEFTKGVPSPIKAYIDSLDRNNDEEVERINQLVIGLLADVKVLTDTYHYISNPEWACAIVDAEEHILMGIKADGSYYIPNRDMYHVESNLEYIKAVVDLEGRVLFGIKNDGSCYIPKGISEEAKKGLIELTAHVSWFENIDNPEWMQVTTDSEGKILEGIDNNGKKYFSKQEMLEKYQDVEGHTEMTLDAEGKIISYRDADGVKYESKQHTEKASFGSMIISNKNANEIEEALKRNGFTTDIPIDWSKEEYVEIPIPRVCAKLNIICNKLPEYNNEEFDGFIEFIDKDGNYFKKPITALAIQGDTSKTFKFKNMSFDLSDDSKIKFGTWVAQDSWHLKKYYIDVFRGQCVVAYWLAEQIYQTHEIGNRKPYEYLYENDKVLTSNGDFKKDIPTGALTHPDGFPIMLYHNGELIGLYAWCLKKHRDNYAMKKSDKKQIILDGTLNSNTIWNGYVDWSEFEIRNPKDLLDVDGNKYDGDNPKELSESDSTSKSVKDSIIRLSNAIQTIKSESTTELQRAKFKEYFNVDFLIDYFILGNYIGDFDGFSKNWIWCTWDGLIWSPTVYDKDSIFGSSAQGTCVHEHIVKSALGTGGVSPSALLWQLFKSEIVSRYKELVSKGVLSVNNVVSLLYKWIDKVGYDNLKKDIEECCVDNDGIPQTPSYRNPQVNDGWIIIGNASKSDVSTYDNDAVYNEGDTCDYCNPNDVRKWGLKFKATKTVQGVPPLNDFYSYFPTEGGYYNSPIRVRNWLIQREAYLSNIFV